MNLDHNSISGMPDGPTCKKIQNYIFKFSDLLGQGNFSKVYKAHHQITDQVVAIKIVQLNSLKSKKLQQLLFSEINVLKKLNHPNILRCFQVFTSNRNCYIITQLCNQGDLQSKLRRRGFFTQQAVQPIIKDIFQGLLYLAQQKVIHRDLKVANVFLHNGKAKIADFGFAKFTLNKFKDINIGSPIYMSPQGFIDNIYGPKTDIWAFGVLIYQLLHGQTPYNFCKTQSELKYNLSLPLSRNRLKSQLSSQIQQVILKCMQIDEEKRITAFQLAKLPYFERLFKKSGPNLNLIMQNNQYLNNQYEYRVRSPSYQQTKEIQNKSINNLRSYDGVFQQRRVSADRNYRNNNLLSVNNIKGMEKGQSPLHFFKNQSNNNQVQEGRKQNYLSTKMLEFKQIGRSTDNFNKLRDRGITTDKRQIEIERSKSIKSIDKKQGLNIVSNSRSPKLISQKLTFKQTVNMLHYGRLIFKYIQLLKEQQNFQTNIQEIYTLTKWLMTILDQVSEKIQKKQISYEGGTNSDVRQKKLIEVTTQYQKKYRKQLQPQLIKINLTDKGRFLTLQYMKNFIYNQYLKYDKMLFLQINRNLIFIGHNIMMIYEVTRLLKKCYDSKDYWLIENYKDIEAFLSKNKESLDLQSYRQKRKGMSIYN